MKMNVRRPFPADAAPAVQRSEQTEHPALPHSVQAEEKSASDLDFQFQRRMETHFPGMSGLAKGSGRALQLPEEVQSSLEGHFGYSIDHLKFRESSDVEQIGAKAYARGDEIHFAPGQFRPDTALGRKMIGHEVAHIAQQAGGGLGSGVQLDPALEHQADVQGERIAAGLAVDAPIHQSGSLTPMPTASFDAAPAQGWGIDVLNREGQGQHEQLTEEARKKVMRYFQQKKEQKMAAYMGNPAGESQEREQMLQEAADMFYAARELESDQAIRSLRYGSRFNDVGHHGAIGMAVQMEAIKGDAFINQTHHGDMQFLHSMDTSGGNTQKNAAKIRRYAQFASDVYQNRAVGNGQHFQDQNMLDYVLSQNGPGDPFQEMMLSMMVDPKVLKNFDEQLRENVDRQTQGMSEEQKREQFNRQRIAGLKQLLTFSGEDEEEVSRAAGAKYDRKNSVSKWFRESVRRKSRDAYIQKKVEKARKEKEKNRSSYANGTIRDFFTNGDQGLNAGMVALGSASHMLEDSFAGSHAIRADNLYTRNGTNDGPDTDLSPTGAEIVQKATPILVHADYNRQSSFILGGRHGKGDVFVGDGTTEQQITNTQGASLARDSAAQFMMMNALMKQTGDTYVSSGLEAFVKGITKTDQSLGASGVTRATLSGRAYDKKYKGEMSKEAKRGVQDYWDETGQHIVGNHHTTGRERAQQLDSEITALNRILSSQSEEDDRVKEYYLPHAREMLANVEQMLDQLHGTGDTEAIRNLEIQKDRLRAMLRLP